MKTVCSLILAVLILTANALPQVYVLSPYLKTIPEIRKAVAGERSFSLPGFGSTVVYAERIVGDDSNLLSLSGVSLKTGDIYVETDRLEYNWNSREGKLIGNAKVLAASFRSTNK
jgi:hypothetical protein